jgi:hypothetical protein
MKSLLLLVLFSMNAWSETTEILKARKYHKCAQASKTWENPMKLEAFFAKNKVIRKSTFYKQEHLIQFANELSKFPEELRARMVKANASFHILNGGGITEDADFKANNPATTPDGRSCKDIPGVGGFPFQNGWDQNPTIIVVNHLYDKHGSINLVLHEHAHALDSTYSLKQISGAPKWQSMAKKPKFIQFVSHICGSYCTDNINEGFAELFAYYHACETTRGEMEEALPRVAQFFKELK